MRAALAACVIAGVVVPAVADAATIEPRPWEPKLSDGAVQTGAKPSAPRTRSQFSVAAGAGVESRYLPEARENFDVVSRFRADAPFGDVKLGQIADLAVHKGFAYLNFWRDEGDRVTPEGECNRGGFQVVDIRNPAKPEQVAFVPALHPYYHGEGAHVITMNTPQFQGDLLAVNNEVYVDVLCRDRKPGEPEIPPNTERDHGGFDLYDVSDPKNPKPLVQVFGDTDQDNDPSTPEADDLPNDYHSVFVWQDGPRAYLVATDNQEETDVDIFDITDPKNPEQIGDYSMEKLFPQILDGEEANGNSVFNHDMVVKKIGDRQVLLVSNWDGGYVQADVTNPRAPKYITDTRFTGEDPLLPGSGLFAEGNAHQSEFSADSQFFLGADEDFAPIPILARVTDGPFANHQFGGLLADSEPVPEGTLIEGDTRFLGDACGPLPPAGPGVTVGLAERGTCAFQVKVQNIQDAGYKVAVIFNNIVGQPERCESLINMLLTPELINIPAIFIRREDAFKIMGVHNSSYFCEDNDPASTPSPAAPLDGSNMRLSAKFDGWGYAHLYDANTSQLIDSYAIPEAMDTRYSSGFGDLSIHEFATDPTEPIAYSSYYAGGIRAFQFSRGGGLQETGKFIDGEVTHTDSNGGKTSGSNFWGIEQFTGTDGERYVAGSDRDFGLVILKYTGPGAPQRPACVDTAATTRAGTSVAVPLTCTDANGNTLTRRITSQPPNGALVAIAGDSVVYTPKAGFTGTDSFLFTANDGAADAAPKTARVTVTPASPYTLPPGTKPDNAITIRFGKFSKGKVKVTVTTKAAGKLTFELRAKLKGRKTTRLYRKTLSRPKGKSSFTVKLSKSNLKKLRQALAKKRSKTLRGSTKTQWTPTLGTRRTVNRSLTLRR